LYGGKRACMSPLSLNHHCNNALVRLGFCLSSDDDADADADDDGGKIYGGGA